MTITISYLPVFFLNDHTIFVNVRAHNAFSELGFRDSNMNLCELTLVHSTFSESAFNHFDVRRAISELDLSSCPDFLSFAPEALI